MREQQRQGRREAVNEHKRSLILIAAREVFEKEGLEGASLRAIAARAGYTPAALYFHFESKEEIYAEVLRASLSSLGIAVNESVLKARTAQERVKAAAMAFFNFYAENPRDLDLGFYLFRGGMKPSGLGDIRDRELNEALEAALSPIGEAAEALGATPVAANLLIVNVFAHAVGLLLLLHTGRIRLFGASAPQEMATYVQSQIQELKRNERC